VSCPMKRIFEGETREEANRKADEWWAREKGVRFVHRSQVPAGFRSNGSSQWAVEIHYKKAEVSSSFACPRSHRLSTAFAHVRR